MAPNDVNDYKQRWVSAHKHSEAVQWLRQSSQKLHIGSGCCDQPGDLNKEWHPFQAAAIATDRPQSFTEGAISMRKRISNNSGTAALVISILSLIVASSGVADATRQAIAAAVGGGGGGHRASRHPNASTIDGHRLSARPYPGGLLLLGRNRRFPASAIPMVKNAGEIGGKKLEEIEPSCPPTTVDLGTWCLETSPYPLTNQDAGLNNYFWASQACVAAGGYLPSAAQLIGAAKRVKLESTIHDNRDTATVAEDPSVGLKDQREMSATLVTTAGGSEAAGSEGVSVGATGDPRTGEPNPVPLPANPEPATLQYVTVYSNGTAGGFAGSEPVSEPQNFRCAYDKVPGANSAEEG